MGFARGTDDLATNFTNYTKSSVRIVGATAFQKRPCPDGRTVAWANDAAPTGAGYGAAPRVDIRTGGFQTRLYGWVSSRG